MSYSDTGNDEYQYPEAICMHPQTHLPVAPAHAPTYLPEVAPTYLSEVAPTRLSVAPTHLPVHVSANARAHVPANGRAHVPARNYLTQLPQHLPFYTVNRVFSHTRYTLREAYDTIRGYNVIVGTDEAGQLGIAVLYSPGFGVGFSSFDRANSNILCTYSAIIYHAILSPNVANLTALLVQLGIPAHVVNATSEFALAFVPPGGLFRINDYNGSEHVEIFNVSSWLRS